MKKQQTADRSLTTFASESGKGFTLVEMIVSVALFAIVMTVAVGALLSLTAANKKAQAIQSVMNNLNITLDSMVRNIRMGTDFQCGGTIGDCPQGSSSFTFTCNPQTVTCSSGGSSWTYSQCGSAICRTSMGNITAPEVSISSLRFYVVGSVPGDMIQPKVVIVVSGTAGGQNVRTQTSFHIQASAVQRELDL